MTIKGKTLTDDGWKENDPIVINCIVCGGSGTISDEKKQNMDEENAGWCTCKESEKAGSHYIDDNTPGAFYEKHHWICNSCGKVTQVG